MNFQPLTTTQAVDTAFYVIFGISGLALLGIIVAMIALLWRYNRDRQPRPISQKDHNVWLEIVWTVIPTALVMVMFWYGWEGYLSLRRIPDNAMPVTATARMWSWLFTYDNGKTADKLYVPVDKPVRVKLVAEDVLHSFYVPAFRVKRDCVPGMDTYAWFVAEKPGSYDIFCAEYCGVGHADMITTVEALPKEAFEAWLAEKPAAADAGRALLQQHGCLGCHSLDGSRGVGPTFQGIGGREVKVTTDGAERTLSSDRDYLEAAILEPGRDIVVGYPPAMPSYAGKIPQEELNAILDYLLGQPAATTSPAPAQPAAPPPEKPEAPAAAEESDTSPDQAEAEATADAAKKDTASTPAEAAMTDETTSETDVADDPVAAGEALANQHGCLGCHSLDGSRRVGPSLLGVASGERSVTRDGEEVTLTVDDDYLARALREPSAEIVTGYPPAMPPYPQLSDAQVEALIAWMKSLK